MADFIPSRDGDLIPWEQNVSNKIPDYAATFGLSPAHPAAIQALCQTHTKLAVLLTTSGRNLVKLKIKSLKADIIIEMHRL